MILSLVDFREQQRDHRVLEGATKKKKLKKKNRLVRTTAEQVWEGGRKRVAKGKAVRQCSLASVSNGHLAWQQVHEAVKLSICHNFWRTHTSTHTQWLPLPALTLMCATGFLQGSHSTG